MLERPSAVLAAIEDGDRMLTIRRRLFAALVIATMAGLLWLMVATLAPGRWGLLDAVIIGLFALTLPWTVIGFWNALIGFLLMRFTADPVTEIFPAAHRALGSDAVQGSTAILVCIRNEPPDRVIRNLDVLLSGLARAGVSDRFHLYVLSDTDDPAIAEIERERFASLETAWRDCLPVTYRRRSSNEGFKAGNLRDFCERWGERHEYAVTLDADSLMSAPAVFRLLQIMQRNPRIGILQGMVVGLPSSSAFARIFQFGMRLGMRSFTLGSAWWQGDCGPYWGHNAVLRLKPFIEHCQLPLMPDGSHVLSHDQVEAVMMRRAGYEVRVMPDEDLGWEDNPPTLLEFMRRDLRWCQGNMQYWPFVRLPGLARVSRFQLAFAMLMFLNSPAWIGLLVAGSLLALTASYPALVVASGPGHALLVAVLLLWFAPKLGTAIDVLMRKEARREFGGTIRFVASFCAEIVFSLLLLPILWFSHTLFLAAALFGKRIGWGGQKRDGHAVSWRDAASALWPHTLLGLTVLAALALNAPEAIAYALLLAGGLALSIPFAVLTSWPRVGALLTQIGVGRLPEETDPPEAIAALALPAFAPATAAASLPCPSSSR
jgi:membrane glycosyltransferase